MCTTCAEGEFLHEKPKTCYEKGACPAGTFAEAIKGGGFCKDCLPGCGVCTNDSDCSECFEGFYKESNECLSCEDSC